MKDIINKIKKLLALANENSNATEGEIQNALAMAQRLMQKHNIHLSQLTESEFEKQEADRKSVFRKNGFHKWEKMLSQVVAKATETETFYAGRALHNMTLNFVGLKVDTICAIELFNYLQFHVNRLGKEHAGGIWSSYRSFCYGCVERLFERVEDEMARRKREEKTDCTALVLRKEAKIKKVFELEGIQTEQKKSAPITIDVNSHMAGRVAAEALDIGGKVRRLEGGAS